MKTIKNYKNKYRVIITLVAVMLFGLTKIFSAGEGFRGIKTTDPYPLHQTLQYEYYSDRNGGAMALLSDVIKSLDIENNERYLQTGVKYQNGKAHEIPRKEVKDFGIETSHNNTYCNIFVIDVLNIMANTTKDESFRITKNPVGANVLRTRFEESPYWQEVSRNDAIRNAQSGKVVIMSYTERPNGHVAFLRKESTTETIWMWNVGAVNEEKHKWNERSNTKYFMKI